MDNAHGAGRAHPTDAIIATIVRLYRSIRVEDVQTALDLRAKYFPRIRRRLARKDSAPGRRKALKLW